MANENESFAESELRRRAELNDALSRIGRSSLPPLELNALDAFAASATGQMLGRTVMSPSEVSRIRKKLPQPEAPTLTRSSAPLAPPPKTTSDIDWRDPDIFVPSGYLLVPDTFDRLGRAMFPADWTGDEHNLIETKRSDDAAWIRCRAVASKFQSAAEGDVLGISLRRAGSMHRLPRRYWNRENTIFRNWLANCAINEVPTDGRGLGHDLFEVMFISAEDVHKVVRLVAGGDGQVLSTKNDVTPDVIVDRLERVEGRPLTPIALATRPPTETEIVEWADKSVAAGYGVRKYAAALDDRWDRSLLRLKKDAAQAALGQARERANLPPRGRPPKTVPA